MLNKNKNKIKIKKLTKSSNLNTLKIGKINIIFFLHVSIWINLIHTLYRNMWQYLVFTRDKHQTFKHLLQKSRDKRDVDGLLLSMDYK